MSQGPTPEELIVATGGTVIEETPSSGCAANRLLVAATTAELSLRPNMLSDVESPADSAPPEALGPAVGNRRRRTVLRPMRGAMASASVSVWFA